MSNPLVPDELWAAIGPLFAVHPCGAKGGRPWADDRAALGGILFVLRSGIAWEMLPWKIGCCGMTCWRCLRDW